MSTMSGIAMSDGVLYVSSAVHTLPPVCVKCAAPCSGTPIKKRFAWHSSWWYALALLGLLVYVIAAVMVQKRHALAVYLCDTHRRERLALMVAGFLALPGFSWTLCLLVPRGGGGGPLYLSALVLALLGLVVGFRAARILSVVEINTVESSFRGASPDLLAARTNAVASVFE